MSRIDSLRSELARLKQSEGRLRKELAGHEATVAVARKDAGSKRQSAARSRNASSINSYLRSAVSLDHKATESGKKAAAVAEKIGRNAKDQASKQAAIASAEEDLRKERERADKKRRREELTHARQVHGLLQSAPHLARIPEPKPERLRVLYVTANPEATERIYQRDDGSVVEEGRWLQTDREVRDVRKALKSALHRDLIDLEHLPAATFADLIDGTNERRPHVIHFSGHAAEGALLFDDGLVHSTQARPIPLQWIADLLAATTTPPILVVLNACDSLVGAEALLETVAVIIGMRGEVGDIGARVFAVRFYAAIAEGQPAGMALQQARLGLKDALLLDDASLLESLSRSGTDLDQVVLVKGQTPAA
ncbi:hypothetical protein Mesau_05940 [Mesorhizobium australicum WSM2073]|uniref:CHAT domain-containing protein n=3 Tax=Mesorhizobium TaxID=68287 RepID=L0KSS3_MESAW|nr:MULTISPECIES: CHAT domain-containing protein [Mesorhizobium]ADV14909.1 hypothetical protein Mesci_5896 [Mesorhizobium ciceri biovar biserrulae WSM1271]AEH90795.1 hypothetical protein Mesop_6465 [Mesorhizobium opportunistum WSM2075]AGB48166.1 hypothetical protein Mesau_05940 [Mesorhizobium australicum WSM2073]OBP84732.1 hypothetical protein BAE40_29710 [Mesorhizobium loti]